MNQFKVSKNFLFMIMVLLAATATSGCQSTYFAAMEKIGFEKRDLLYKRVKGAKKAQKSAQEEFESAYEEFATLVNYDGGDLEAKYNQLKKRYDRAVEKSENVTEKREDVESVGKALFREWRSEINLYTSEQLKSRSLAQLRTTEQQFERLVAQLIKAEAKIQPVLDPFRDRVLYLKHNLNARAINAMRSDNVQMQQNIRALIQDMQRAIQEADEFIEAMDATTK